MAGGRSRLRNRGRGTSYGSTFLGQTDPSAPSTSRTPDNVPDSQIPSVPQAVDHVAPYIPQYDDAAYFTYEEPRHDQQPHDPQTHDQQPHDQYHPQPASQPAPQPASQSASQSASQPPPYQPPHQVPQPAAYQPPHQAPAAPGLHPDLLVPPNAPYARYSVEDILQVPGREGLPILDPDLRPNTTSAMRSLTCSAARMTRDADGNLPIPHTSGQTPHAKRAQHADGTFSHLRAEKLCNDVEARIQEVQTQLTQENPDGAPVQLSGIGSVNDVPRARVEYAARREEESSLRRDLENANRAIAENNDKWKAISSVFDMMIASTPNVNPSVTSAWQTLRSNFAVSDPTPEEQADLHRRAEQRSSEMLISDKIHRLST